VAEDVAVVERRSSRQAWRGTALWTFSWRMGPDVNSQGSGPVEHSMRLSRTALAKQSKLNGPPCRRVFRREDMFAYLLESRRPYGCSRLVWREL